MHFLLLGLSFMCALIVFFDSEAQQSWKNNIHPCNYNVFLFANPAEAMQRLAVFLYIDQIHCQLWTNQKQCEVLLYVCPFHMPFPSVMMGSLPPKSKRPFTEK